MCSITFLTGTGRQSFEQTFVCADRQTGRRVGGWVGGWVGGEGSQLIYLCSCLFIYTLLSNIYICRFPYTFFEIFFPCLIPKIMQYAEFVL